MSVTVAYREEMAVSQVQNVGVGQIRILIYLVWVMRRNATFGCKRELGHDVVHPTCVSW